MAAHSVVWLSTQGFAFWRLECWAVLSPHKYPGSWHTALPPSWTCFLPCVILTLAQFSGVGQEGTRTSKSSGFLKPPTSGSGWLGSGAPAPFSLGDHTYVKGYAALWPLG